MQTQSSGFTQTGYTCMYYSVCISTMGILYRLVHCTDMCTIQTTVQVSTLY